MSETLWVVAVVRVCVQDASLDHHWSTKSSNSCFGWAWMSLDDSDDRSHHRGTESMALAPRESSDNRPGFDSERLELFKVLSFPVGYLVKHSNSFSRAIVGPRTKISEIA